VPVGDVRRFESEFLDYIGRGDNGIYDEIRTSRALGDDAVSSLERAVEAFYGQFTTTDGSSLTASDEDAEPMDASERGQQTVQRKRG
jgi:F-type H+-transporting ATPase subunit alpha